MKKLVAILGLATISASLGISDERKEEIVKKAGDIAKEEMEKADGTHVSTLVRVWNEFAEKENECAFAMYILTHEEDNAVINKLFASEGAPEAVAN